MYAYVVVLADLRGVDASFELDNVLSQQQVLVLWQTASENTTTSSFDYQYTRWSVKRDSLVYSL